MNTNHDAFEHDLRELRGRELPAEWRDDILSAAKSLPAGSRTPRWLVAGWSAAWAAILMMYFTMPSEPDTRTRSVRHVPVLRLDERASLIEALLASN
jgi:hypothetical protein